MIIRNAAEADGKEAAEIYRYYVDNFPYSFEYTAPSAKEFSERITLISEKFPFSVCEEGGEILGYAYAHQFKERKAYQWVCETTVYVKKGCTQNGIGRMLYAQLLQALKSRAMQKHMLFSGVRTKAAKYFIKKWVFAWQQCLQILDTNMVHGTI